MAWLHLRAYLQLVRFDIHLARKDFAGLYSAVRNCPTVDPGDERRSIDSICTAVDEACIWYWKEALCLQRSAAVTCLLRKHGVPAIMALGVQQMPFKGHAWVEVDGRVVNDKPYVPEIYSVIERC